MNDSQASPQPDSYRQPMLSTTDALSQSAGAEKGIEPDYSRRDRQSDRRKRRRALISAPLRVRGLDVEGPDELSTTVDVSRNGILFVTSNTGFHRGMEVAVTFPYTKSPSVPQSEQPGNVVRVSALSHGRIAVAIAFGLGSEERIVDATKTRPDAAAIVVREPDFSDIDDSKKPLVLTVESDPEIRDSLKAYLSGEGYKVIAVDNATDAREVLDIMTPALLIAEIEGEGLPGFDLCAHVKSTPRLKHIPVMLTTGSAYPSDYSNAHSLGAVVCMAKPYRQERLGHVVRLLVAPGGLRPNAEPPRAPDPSRRHRGAAALRRGISGSLRFR
jgi:two-component system, cell cycle response regulator DivK